MTFREVHAALASIGITIRRTAPGTHEYRVNYKVGGTEGTAYYASDLDDALNTGRAMALHGRSVNNPTYKKYAGREGSAEFRRMTLEEGKTLKYGDSIWVLARDGSARRAKVNGAVKRWKREPDRIEVPFKYGMYEYGTFHTRDFGEQGDVLVEI
jgi:hypothetical protein